MEIVVRVTKKVVSTFDFLYELFQDWFRNLKERNQIETKKHTANVSVMVLYLPDVKIDIG